MRMFTLVFLFFQNFNLWAEINLNVSYPVNQELFVPGSYFGRSFFYDNDHLGEDIKLVEGSPIKAVLAGKIVKYGPAGGYGNLVVVIESDLGLEVEFVNAYGKLRKTDQLLFIYGHLKKESLNWQEGDFIETGQVLGYVENKNYNGDGSEHLHLGARLQGQLEAMQFDPYAWFRGYEKSTSFGQDFAAPSKVIEKLLSLNLENNNLKEELKITVNLKVTWHPNGTLIKGVNNSDVYVLIKDKKHLIKDEIVFNSLNLDWQKIILVSQAELDCYEVGYEVDWLSVKKVIGNWGNQSYYLLETIVGQNDNCATYEILTTSVLNNWGFEEGDIGWLSEDEFKEKYHFCDNVNFLYWRPGTLIKPNFKLDFYGESVVFFVSDFGVLKAFDSYEVFKDLGYTNWSILNVSKEDFFDSYASFGENITSASLSQCLIKGDTVENKDVIVCEEGEFKESYSGEKESLNVGLCQSEFRVCINNSWKITQKEVLPEIEIKDGLDNDCDGQVDEDFEEKDIVVIDKDIIEIKTVNIVDIKEFKSLDLLVDDQGSLSDVQYEESKEVLFIEDVNQKAGQDFCSDVADNEDFFIDEQKECSVDLIENKDNSYQFYCSIQCKNLGFSPVVWSGGWVGEFYEINTQENQFSVDLCDLCIWGEPKFHFNCKKENIYNYGDQANVNCWFKNEELELKYSYLGQGKTQVKIKNFSCNNLCWN